MSLLYLRHLAETLVIVLNFQDDHPENWLKTSSKRPFFDTKSAIERPRRLEIAENWFVMMRICSLVSYLDANG